MFQFFAGHLAKEKGLAANVGQEDYDAEVFDAMVNSWSFSK